MLIEQYDLEVFTPPCDPGAERFAATTRLAVDISRVLPYLNATLRGAVYLPEAEALTWKKGGHNIAFHAYEIATSNVEDRDSAEKVLRGLIDLVNQTWERRAEITPDTTTRQRPTSMAIFKLLPQTNCKQCGEQTCYTFALKLAASQKKLADCPPLFEHSEHNWPPSKAGKIKNTCRVNLPLSGQYLYRGKPVSWIYFCEGKPYRNEQAKLRTHSGEINSLRSVKRTSEARLVRPSFSMPRAR
jgi:ArsR family metal-binding transcriptional regulator